MSRKKIVTILSLGALVVALAFGAVAYVSAKAATPTPSAATTNTSSPLMDKAFMGGGRGGFAGGFAGGFTIEELATALGISTTDLTAAYTKANEAALAQAVSKGLITQAQADEIQANGSTFPLGDRWGGWLTQNGIDFNALLADALGITVDKLQAAYAQAYNAHIDAAVTAGTLTQDQASLMKGEYALKNDKAFQSSMQTAYQAAIQQAVTDGVITQAQADLILKNSANQGFNGLGGFPGFGDFGGHGPRGGGGPQNGLGGNTPANPANSATPTTTP